MNICVRIVQILTLGLALGACTEENMVSHELVMSLQEMEVTCTDIKKEKIGKLFWVKPVMDGWGILVISKSNEENQYQLSLISHGHERVLETRILQCGSVIRIKGSE